MEENIWIKRAENMAQEVLSAQAADVDRKARWPAESMAALRNSGLLGLTLPREVGGAGEGPRTFTAVTRALAEQCASTAMIYVMHVCATRHIAAAPEFPQRDAVLRAIAAGKHLATLAFSEKGSRSHFWAPISQAATAGDGYRLTAEKSFVTSAGHADSYVVSTRGAGRTEPLATTLFFVPRDAPGITLGAPWEGMGLRGNASAPLRLQDVPVPALHRLCMEGEGLPAMLDLTLPWFQIGVSAVAVGIARAATEGTRQHLLASRLEHLGQSLTALPNLRARLAQMRILTDTHQVFLEHAADQLAQPGPTTLLAILTSKAAAAEAAVQVTDLAMRTCGGAAFARHLGVERNFRDARAAQIMAPTTDVLHDFIGKSLLNLPLL